MAKSHPMKELEAIRLNDKDIEKLVYVGRQLQGETGEEIIECLLSNVDVLCGH